ncbi:MAG: cation:proton antiporter [Actinomycetota bacterium]|nr:cation:proton antiporter [Actinomycetota bacterium]
MLSVDLVLVVLAGTLLALVLISRVTKRMSLSPVLLALIVGVLVGPEALGVLDLTGQLPRHVLLEQVTRIALALLVADIGLRTRPADLRDNAARLLVLLALVMPAMWLLTGLGAELMFGLPFAVALVLGAALTPTDPGVSSTITTGTLANRSLPRRLRMSLQVESGANDGLAVPFVILSGLLATRPDGPAVAEWARSAGREVGIALILGPLIGFLAAQLLRFAERERAVAETYLPLLGPATAVATLAAAHLAHGTGVLAAFLAGLVLSLTLPEEDLREPISAFHASASRVALIAVFLTFGTVLPLGGWADLGAAGVLFAGWVVFLRRLPAAVPLLRATGTGWRSALFLSWFGPLGVAAIYYLAYLHRYALPEYERLFAAGTLAIVVSVVAAALTSTPAVLAYRWGARSEVPEGEHSQLPGPLP